MSADRQRTADVIRDVAIPRALDWAIGLDALGRPHLSLVVDGTAIQIPDEALSPLVRALRDALRDLKRYAVDPGAAFADLGEPWES